MYYEKMRDDFPTCIREEESFFVILKNESLSPYVYDYRFYFTKSITCSEMFEIAEWCEENLKDDYLIGCASSGFNNKEDAMAFKLRWM